MSRLEHFAMGAGVPELSRAASTYAAQLGQRRATNYANVTANPDVGREVARSYEAAPSFDPAAVPHYRAMREETSRQFEFLTSAARHGGLGVDVQVTKSDPYGNAGELVHDMVHNRRLKVFGTGGPGNEHPFFSNDENDQFRAVHDAFGHGATGRGFDRHGEEAAFRSHVSMYSPVARPAMTTETRGQNSTFIFGSKAGAFPEQKIVTLPNAGRIVPIGRRSVARAQILQARQFHAQAFGQPQ